MRFQGDNRVVIVVLTALDRQVVENTPLSGLPLLRRRLSQLSEDRLLEIDSVLTEFMYLMEACELE